MFKLCIIFSIALFVHQSVAFLSRDNVTLDDEHRHLELSLRNFEMKRMLNVAQESNGIEIKGFYHTSRFREHWADVIEEQMEILDGRRSRLIPKKGDKSSSQFHHWASLLDISSNLEVHVAGTNQDYEAIKNVVDNLKLRNSHRISFVEHPTVPRYINAEQQKVALAKHPDVSSGEVPTMDAIHAYCVKQRDAKKKSIVYYFHNKGACCSKASNGPVSNWRDLMNAWILEFPSVCLRALVRGYSACGINYQDAHYSGNFWWASCDHIAELPVLPNKFDALAAEFFLYRTTDDYGQNLKYSKHCGYNPFHCEVNTYDVVCPRSKYIPTLLNNLIDDKLPKNPTATINSTIAFVREKCSAVRALSRKDRKQYLMQLN